MSESFRKYINRLPSKQKELLERLVNAIEGLNLEGLDVKKLKGVENVYRVRVGNCRIVFSKIDEKRARILQINTRGDIY